MTERTCTVEGCCRKFLARGFCGSHYATWFRKNRPKQKTCTECGASFSADRPSTNVCSKACVAQIKARSPKWLAHLAAVEAAKASRPAPVPTPPRPRPDQRTPLRKAYESRDWIAAASALRDRCVLTSDGCWEWTGKTQRSSKSKNPYPVTRWSNKMLQVHRLAATIRYGAELGTQQAHHTCANTICVNPEHIQAVTQIENLAEMKARVSYEARIGELEEALARLEPSHPLLDRVGYGRQARA